ncbi:MAG: transcription antitermination factor NusB [Syntrophales bacterium]|jgi:N utilization substance protein B|nr:transcription antitermination factor NusB [Syntrophales bacterium]
MHKRRKSREIALQILYGLDTHEGELGDAIALFWANFDNASGEMSEEIRRFSNELVEGAWKNRLEIDRLISGNSENWSIGRMSRVDKSILRMAIYELLFCPEVPPKVALNEAIDLGKIYGSENSGSFINGILDALYEKLPGKNEAGGSEGGN